MSSLRKLNNVTNVLYGLPCVACCLGAVMLVIGLIALTAALSALGSGLPSDTDNVIAGWQFFGQLLGGSVILVCVVVLFAAIIFVALSFFVSVLPFVLGLRASMKNPQILKPYYVASIFKVIASALNTAASSYFLIKGVDLKSILMLTYWIATVVLSSIQLHKAVTIRKALAVGQTIA